MAHAALTGSIRVSPMGWRHLGRAAQLFYLHLQPLSKRDTAYYLLARRGVYVVLVDERVAGITVALDTGEVLWWDFVTNDPAYRRLGLMRLMMDHLLEAGAAEGFRSLELSTDQGNLPMQRFWQKLGIAPDTAQPLPGRVHFKHPIVPVPGARRTRRFGNRGRTPLEWIRRMLLTPVILWSLRGVRPGASLSAGL